MYIATHVLYMHALKSLYRYTLLCISFMQLQKNILQSCIRTFMQHVNYQLVNLVHIIIYQFSHEIGQFLNSYSQSCIKVCMQPQVDYVYNHYCDNIIIDIHYHACLVIWLLDQTKGQEMECINTQTIVQFNKQTYIIQSYSNASQLLHKIHMQLHHKTGNSPWVQYQQPAEKEQMQ